MNKPLKVGITGGIGSGKSTAVEIFRLIGIPVYDADLQAKRLMVSDTGLMEKIKLAFGKDSYKEGHLNRQYLANKVFNNSNAVNKLNELVHPAVESDFNNWISQQDTEYILKEAALLFEAGSYQELDYTILVLSPLETRVNRIKERDPQRSTDQIMNIINKQMNVEKAKELTDLWITNDEQSMLIPQVLSLHNSFKEKSPDI